MVGGNLTWYDVAVVHSANIHTRGKSNFYLFILFVFYITIIPTFKTFSIIVAARLTDRHSAVAAAYVKSFLNWRPLLIWLGHRILNILHSIKFENLLLTNKYTIDIAKSCTPVISRFAIIIFYWPTPNCLLGCLKKCSCHKRSLSLIT